MNKAERLNAVSNLINNIANNRSTFVDARALEAVLIAIKEDMQERYLPDELNINSERYDPLNSNRIIQS